MARREFLQLAKTFKLGKDNPAGMYVSEKLDGTRVFWDGGITRGLPTEQVPWANIMDPKKPGERKKKILPMASGLWSRYGNPIMAPDWWLNRLPNMLLDGELFAGRGNFQTLRSIVAKDKPEGEAWLDVQFAVFGTPTPALLFQPGEIKNPNFHLNIDQAEILRFVKGREPSGVLEEMMHMPQMTFSEELSLLQTALPQDDVVYLHRHQLLPESRTQAEKTLDTYMDQVLDQGGEGIMLRQPESMWTPKRVNTLLKLKPFSDAQGTLVGFVSGRKTDKGSKLRGLIGALILDYNGKRLELSGMTDAERKFSSEEATRYAWNNPGLDMPIEYQGAHFKTGDTVEFRYRELSDGLLPKEARFYRGV